MINITKGKLYELAASGSARYNVSGSTISIDAVADKIPQIGTVRASQFDPDNYSYGYANSAHVLNHQLFRHSQVPHVPCDVSSSAEYDTGAKKILYRQHVSFWREQTYDRTSTGDGITPGTPFTVPLLAHAMPQMKQQSAWLSKYVHTVTFKTPELFATDGMARFGNVELQFSRGARNTLNLNTETDSYAGAEIHNHETSTGEVLVFYSRKTPLRNLNIGGFFTRWFATDVTTTFDTPPTNWMYIDCLDDQVIASSRDIHGFGNTSNAGLSSYGYLANLYGNPAVGAIDRKLHTVTTAQIPVFQNVSSPTPFMTIPEPNTDPAAVSVDDRTLLPSLTSTSGSIRSDLDMFGGNSLYEMKYPDGLSTATFYHRIQQLRCYYTQLYDLQFANPEDSIHI